MWIEKINKKFFTASLFAGVCIVLLLAAIKDANIVFNQNEFEEIAKEVLSDIQNNEECLSNDICSVMLILPDTPQRVAISSNIVSDTPQAAAKMYGFMLEQSLLAEGFKLTRYFNSTSPYGFGIVVEKNMRSSHDQPYIQGS